MTYVLVDVQHRTHTCPANHAEIYPYDTVRTVVGYVPSGPCRQPVTIRSGDITATIPCGRHEPRERQCPPCLVTVTERHITTEFMGHHAQQHPSTGAAA
jgi:hypothetical protein